MWVAPDKPIYPYHQTLAHHCFVHRIIPLLRSHLLEDLAISPLIGLTIDLDWLVPRPLVIYELTVRLLSVVEFSKLVALKVRCDIESRKGLLAANEESALEYAVVADAVHGDGAKEVFAGGLKACEETT